MKLHVVATHGIGYTARLGFSNALRRRTLVELQRRHDTPPQKLGWYPAVWAEEPQKLEEELYKRLYPKGEPFPIVLNPLLLLLRLLGLDKPRRFSLHYIGDIFVYYTHEYRSRIHEALRLQLQKIVQHHQQELQAGHPVYFALVGHSLGSVIAFDVLHESVCAPGLGCSLRTDRAFTASSLDDRYAEIMPGLFLTNLFTLGSPLAIFSLRQEDIYHQFRSGLRPFRYLEGGAWFNFYDDQDWISFPLESVFNQPGAEFVCDRKVNNSLTPLNAHGGYWRSKKVARCLAGRLAKDWKERP